MLYNHQEQVLFNLLLPLSSYLKDSSVQEIMINSPNNIWIEKTGKLSRIDCIDIEASRISGIILALAGESKKEVSASSPIVDMKLGTFRVAACISPYSIDGDSICIRKQSHLSLSTLDYAKVISNTAVSEKIHCPSVDRQDANSINEFLEWLISERKNFLISGGTSSGKTLFFKTLLKLLPENERYVTIEDVPELWLDKPNVVRFEANEQAGVSIRKLLKLSFRYRPDRIFVGEIRGEEAYDFLRAASSGHDGGGCSIHASNPIVALETLSSLVLEGSSNGTSLISVKNRVASTVNFVIQMERKNGERIISSIEEVEGFDGERFKTKPII